MQLTDVHNPNERKKVIGAAVLGLVAIVLLWWTFFGFGGGSQKGSQPPAGTAVTTSSGSRPPDQRAQPLVERPVEIVDQLRPVNSSYSLPSVPEARRNIFAYYEAPVKPPPVPPTPTPIPPPPVLLANVSPATIFARTGEFTLEISGDKFEPQLKVLIDNSEVPTRFRGPQQMSATVSAALIANPGSRQVALRSPDGKLYSNALAFSVAAPPTPNYNYIGIIGTPRYIDTAILQDKGNRDVINVQRGDLLGGRFRVTSISERELVVVDTTLKIRHVVPYSNQGDRGSSPLRPPPRVETEDDEP